MICASMSFASQMKSMRTSLEELGHVPLTTKDLDHLIANPHIIDDLDADLKHCIENDIYRSFFDLVGTSDAILVLNYPKNGTAGYIGASTLMELAVGYYLRKQLYLLEDPPSYHDVRWAHEVAIMQPTIIHGDLKLIK